MSSFHEKLQVDLLFSDDASPMHAIDLLPTYFLLIPVFSKIPLETWGAFGSSRIAIPAGRIVFRAENEIRLDFRAGRRIKLQSQGVGFQPWLPERVVAGDRFSSK